MHGEVESTEPYVIKLTNTFDDDDVLQTRLSVDPERRSLLFTTNYDLGKRRRERKVHNKKTVRYRPFGYSAYHVLQYPSVVQTRCTRIRHDLVNWFNMFTLV